MPTLLTHEQARKAIERQGISIADFARTNNLDEHTVYQVLKGKKLGLRGEAHRAAVLLGIKEGTLPDRPAPVAPLAENNNTAEA